MSDSPTDIERIVAVATASRAGSSAAEAWRAWDPALELATDGAPAWNRDAVSYTHLTLPTIYSV